MPTHWVWLYSDGLLWWLVLLVMIYAVHVWRHPHLQAPWRKVASHRVGMVAAVVLCFYAGICLLDSLHWQATVTDTHGVTQTRTVSALDHLLPKTMRESERTYSSPLSQQAFTLSSWQDAKGESVRGYAPLEAVVNTKYPTRDVMMRLLRGAAIGMGVVLGLYLLVNLFQGFRPGVSRWQLIKTVWSGQSEYAWRAVWITLLLLSVLACMGWQLADGYHLMGTTQVGQDVLYESIKSIRTGIVIGTLTTLFMLPLALILGLCAGYFGGWCDDIIQYCYITLSSIPGVLLISATILVLQVTIHQHADWFPTMEARADIRLLALCLILGLTSWATLCRLLRAETMKLKHIL